MTIENIVDMTILFPINIKSTTPAVLRGIRMI
jgi:hypothetical protein